MAQQDDLKLGLGRPTAPPDEHPENKTKHQVNERIEQLSPTPNADE